MGPVHGDHVGDHVARVAGVVGGDGHALGALDQKCRVADEPDADLVGLQLRKAVGSGLDMRRRFGDRQAAADLGLGRHGGNEQKGQAGQGAGDHDPSRLLTPPA
jgi:hypothetical protein